jgi:hypothetical protein
VSVKSQSFYYRGAQFRYSNSDPWSDGGQWLSELHDLQISISDGGRYIKPFLVKHMNCSGGLLSGNAGVGHWNGWPCGWDYEPGPLSPGSYDSLRTSLLARTNPSRPSIHLPVFLFELRDIPHMVKEMGAIGIALRDKGAKKFFGSLSTQSLAKGNLAFQFGWQPFVEDLWKMVTFQEKVDKRRKELEKLASGRGLLRRVKTLEQLDYSFTTDYLPVKTDTGVSIYRKYVVRQSTHTWGVARWRPTYNGSIPTRDIDIRRMLTGLDAGSISADVWAALPWSWMTDYFFNVSKILQAGNRTVATPSEISVCTESTAQVYYEQAGDSNWWLTPFNKAITTRQRNIDLGYISDPTASLPTLDAGQLSILGSLAIAKNPRVFR